MSTTMRKGSTLLPTVETKRPSLAPSDGQRMSMDARRMSMRKGSLFPGIDGARRASNVGARLSMRTGPSLMGLLASKRLAKKLTSRFYDRRYGNRPALPPKKEPTYRMEPYNKFCPMKVANAMQEVLSSRLGTMRYTPKLCANMTSILSDEIKERVKGLGFDRYKLVVVITLGQKKDQGVMVTSRAAWDASLDNYSTYTYENGNIFCTASVFGVYAE